MWPPCFLRSPGALFLPPAGLPFARAFYFASASLLNRVKVQRATHGGTQMPTMRPSPLTADPPRAKLASYAMRGLHCTPSGATGTLTTWLRGEISGHGVLALSLVESIVPLATVVVESNFSGAQLAEACMYVVLFSTELSWLACVLGHT